MYQYTAKEEFILDSDPTLIIDPEKARLKALGLPYQHIGKVESEEVSKSKEEKPNFIQKLSYLYNMRIPFDRRMGLKKMYYSLERDPMEKVISQAMKDFFEMHNMRPHASGEYPVPENLEQYQYLEQTDISEDCCSFKPKDASEFGNAIEADLHKKAVEVYKKTHYIGSEEEAADSARERAVQYEQQMQRIQNIKDELEYLENEADVELPDDCRFINQKNVCIDLVIGSYDSFIATLENGMYDRFDNKKSKYGVLYRINKDFRTSWSEEYDVECTSALLSSLFDAIDIYKHFRSLSTLELLKKDMIDTVNNRCRYASKRLATPISEKEKISLLQRVEDFFGTKGIVAETILPEPIVIPRWHKYY